MNNFFADCDDERLLTETILLDISPVTPLTKEAIFN